MKNPTNSLPKPARLIIAPCSCTVYFLGTASPLFGTRRQQRKETKMRGGEIDQIARIPPPPPCKHASVPLLKAGSCFPPRYTLALPPRHQPNRFVCLPEKQPIYYLRKGQPLLRGADNILQRNNNSVSLNLLVTDRSPTLWPHRYCRESTTSRSPCFWRLCRCKRRNGERTTRTQKPVKRGWTQLARR